MAADVSGILPILRQTDLLRSAPPEDLAAVAAASRLRRLRRGQMVFTAGDRSDTLVLVVSGRVKVVVRSADGGELTLTVIQPGGTFGEISVADGGPRSADAETLEESRLLFVPGELIRELSSRVPSVAQALMGSIASSLRRLTDAASDLVFLDLPRRVAKVLLGLPRGGDGVIEPKMSQEELAHQVGGTRQSVNAALRGFERRGWIGVEGRAVTVKQPEALNRFANQVSYL
jgi:CRP/FNR family transcriptional regulator, cyclic AMP receptor protein